MNSKLQDTLDTLDALSVSAAHELIQEQRVSEILRRKLSHSMSYARDVEKERDDLREVVETLVHQGEAEIGDSQLWLVGDYTKCWRHIPL